MTLTLVDPSSAAVVHHPSGLISVRLADYVGPARGDLSTDTDALASAGTCVVEEQQQTVPSVFTGWNASSAFATADDSAVIPVDDIGLAEDLWYWPFVSLRTTGDAPSTGRHFGSLLQHDGNFPSFGVAYGVGSPGSPSFEGHAHPIPNGAIPHYTIRPIATSVLTDFDWDPGDELVVRAWNPDGGATSIRLDTLYFLPWSDNGDSGRFLLSLFPNDGILALFGNGTLWRDNDEDATDLPFGGGKFSVAPWGPPWAPDGVNWGQIVDFQKDDLEPSSTDLSTFGAANRRSRFIAPVGVTFVPGPLEIMVDDFSFAQGIHATYGVHRIADIGKEYLRTLATGDLSTILDSWNHPDYVILGTWVMFSGVAYGPAFVGDPADFGAGLGEGICTTFFGDSNDRDPDIWPGNLLPDGRMGFYGFAYWGANSVEGGFSASESSTNPRLRSKQYAPDSLETFVAEFTAHILDDDVNAGITFGVNGQTLGNTVEVFANLAFNAGGAVELDLQIAHFASSYHIFDGPATITGSWSPGDTFRVKVEKRGYFWRAKAWADGDAEPGAWDVEGFQPWEKLTTGTGWIDYPYDDEWVAGGAANDSVRWDPRGGPPGVANGITSGTSRGGGYLASYHYGERQQNRFRICMGDLTVYHVPEEADPTEGFIRIDDYLGNAIHGELEIPYGAHHFVESDLAFHTFNGGANGMDIYLWKDGAAPDWQTTGIGRIVLLFPGVTFRPHIYRRVLG